MARCASCGQLFPPGSGEAPTRLGPSDAPTVLGSGDAPTILGSGDAPTILGSGDAPTILGSGPGAGDTDSPTVLGTAPPAPAAAPARRVSEPGQGPLDVGQAFGRRYHIIKLLGLGGMGAVYQAWDAELGTAVAIKVIRPEAAASPDAAADLERRFKRELLLARQVTHKNVVRIHDLGEIDGIKYITMPFVDGEDLSAVLRREGRLPVPRVMRLARSTVAGLVAAHDAGVVHRDLKPANIMVDADDEALIMDFGIARSSGGPTVAAGSPDLVSAMGASRPGAAKAHETVLGVIVGTVEYMAPEQARGLHVDQRADVYAFGLILRDMLLGRVRVTNPADAIAELQGRMEQAPAAPRSVDPAIPESLDRIVMRCLLPDPAGRFQTTRELAAEFERLDADGKPLPIQRRLTRRLAAVAVVVVGLLLAGTWWLAGSQAPPAPHAPVSVLVADFVNGPHDPVFDGALENALSIAIEGASFITTYPRRAGTPLDETAARLLSIREGVNRVVAGRIDARGSGYVISATVINPSTEKPLATTTASASSKADVLKAVGTVAGRIRSTLGDVAPDTGGAETITAASLDAVRVYSQAQSLAQSGKDADAIDLYRQAIAIDPNFGRAYSGLATSLYKSGHEAESKDAWDKAVDRLGAMTERERYRTQGTYFLGVAKNYDKAIDNYQQLVKKYPADGAGNNNLAIAYFGKLDFKNALEYGRRVRDIYPRRSLYRGNFALYAMYAGDFPTALKEATALLKDDPTYYKAYLPIAMSALRDGKAADAREAYAKMATVNKPKDDSPAAVAAAKKANAIGASMAALGLADLAISEGRLADAEALLTAGLRDDEENRNSKGQASKHIALGELYLASGRRAAAIAAAKKAAELSSDRRAPAAWLLVDAGDTAAAVDIAGTVSNELAPVSRAYGKSIEARLAQRARRPVEAIGQLQDALKLADLWMVRYQLGVAYVELGADHALEGQTELQACEARMGEATAFLLDDLPSFRVMAPLKYWLARAEESLGHRAEAKSAYAAFIAIRPGAVNDPLVRDAQKRLKGLS
jgi:predicted Zn-dependent protease